MVEFSNIQLFATSDVKSVYLYIHFNWKDDQFKVGLQFLSKKNYNSTKQLETHHISEQKNANEEGFINNKHFHKNEKFNLATLCHDCHLQVTLGKIIVTGYKHSVNGKFLHYYNPDELDC